MQTCVFLRVPPPFGTGFRDPVPKVIRQWTFWWILGFGDQIHCQREFGNGCVPLAEDSSFGPWIRRWIYPFGGGFDGGFSCGGGFKNPLPKVGGEGPLGPAIMMSHSRTWNAALGGYSQQ